MSGPTGADSSIVSTASELAGERYLGRYRVLAPIGVGSSAAVYRAVDEETGLEVAVKVLADNHSLVPELRQRFLDEVSLLMAVDDPFVAEVYDQGETGSGQPYLVLELADRGTLDQRIGQLRSEGVQPTERDAIVLAVQLAEALSCLHENGIVHRDLTPANLLIRSSRDRPGPAGSGPVGSGGEGPAEVLGPDEQYLLADLGFAKDLQFASGLTAGGGTRGFAAPEQLAEVTMIDHRADVFGATALVRWVVAGSALEPRLADFWATGLAEQPADRHQTMGAWRDHLLDCLHRPGGLGPGPGPHIGDERRDRPRRSWGSVVSPFRPVALGLGLAVLVAAVVSAALVRGDLGGGAGRDAGSDTAAGVGGVEDRSTRSTSGPSASVSVLDVPASADSTAPTTSEPPPSSSSRTGQTTTTVPPTTPTSDGSTTTDRRFLLSPRAYVERPAREAVVAGNLIVDGTASYRDGVVGVQLVIRREGDSSYWHDTTGSFESTWVRFPVPVTPAGGTEVRWSYTIDAPELEPGRYFVRVWAAGSDANDPISDQRFFTIGPGGSDR